MLLKRRILAACAAFFLTQVLPGCDKEESKLPKFEERVHLEVFASWSETSDCVDVALSSNLPPGTTVQLSAEKIANPKGYGYVKGISHAQFRVWVQVSGRKTELSAIFCSEDEGPYSQQVTGLWVQATVGGPRSNLAGFDKPHNPKLQENAVGPKGEKLKGPLARRSGNIVLAKSNLFELPGSKGWK